MRFPNTAINASKTVMFETNPVNANRTNVTILAVWQPVSWITTIMPITSLLTLIVVDRIIYPLCGLFIHLRMRIGLGLFFAFLSALAAMAVEIARWDSYSLDEPITMVNQFPLIARSVATYWPTADLCVLWTMPQLFLFGVGNALFLVGGEDCVHVHVCVCVCMCMCMRACVCTCMYMCASVYVCQSVHRHLIVCPSCMAVYINA